MSQMRLLNSFLQLLFLHRCYACERELLEQESYVCFSCLAQIPETSFHLYPADNEMFYRLAGKVDIQVAASLFYFDKKGKLQSLLEALKYRSAPHIGSFLGELYGRKLKEQTWVKEFEALLPVPLHPRKKIQRGYNQAYEIARGLAKELGLPVVSGALRRKKFTTSQTRKAGSSRWKNVEMAFSLKEDVPNTILLVDDVMTTGSTLEACIRSIKNKKTESPKLGVLTLAIARKH